MMKNKRPEHVIKKLQTLVARPHNLKQLTEQVIRNGTCVIHNGLKGNYLRNTYIPRGKQFNERFINVYLEFWLSTNTNKYKT